MDILHRENLRDRLEEKRRDLSAGDKALLTLTRMIEDSCTTLTEWHFPSIRDAREDERGKEDRYGLDPTTWPTQQELYDYWSLYKYQGNGDEEKGLFPISVAKRDWSVARNTGPDLGKHEPSITRHLDYALLRARAGRYRTPKHMAYNFGKPRRWAILLGKAAVALGRVTQEEWEGLFTRKRGRPKKGKPRGPYKKKSASQVSA